MEQLVRVEWDAEDDSYLLFLQSSGSNEAVARLYTEELEQLKSEIDRMIKEMRE